MTTRYEVPLQAFAQRLSVRFPNTSYVIVVKWNTPAECWIADFYDLVNNPVLRGVALVTGADLLEQFAYLDFGGALIASSDFDPSAVPTYADLGTTGHLFLDVP